LSDWLQFGATIGVAIIGLIGIIIQTKSKEKQENMSKTLDAMRKESKDGDKQLSGKLDTAKMQILKVWLTVELTKVRDKLYSPNEEQKRLLLEAKREYNNLGGDSYVDDMFDELKKSKLL